MEWDVSGRLVLLLCGVGGILGVMSVWWMCVVVMLECLEG